MRFYLVFLLVNKMSANTLRRIKGLSFTFCKKSFVNNVFPVLRELHYAGVRECVLFRTEQLDIDVYIISRDGKYIFIDRIYGIKHLTIDILSRVLITFKYDFTRSPDGDSVRVGWSGTLDSEHTKPESVVKSPGLNKVSDGESCTIQLQTPTEKVTIPLTKRTSHQKSEYYKRITQVLSDTTPDKEFTNIV